MMHRWKRALLLLLALAMAAGLLGTASPEAFAAGESVPYAEEQGLEFVTDTAFQIPLFFYHKKDGEYLPNTEDCKIEPIRDGDYTITELGLSEPDGDGMVELKIGCTVDAIACNMNDGSADSAHTHFTSFTFFDYYSGYTLADKRRSNSGQDSIETVLHCNGEEISVTRDTTWDVKNEWSPWSHNKYGQWQSEWNIKASITYVIRFPAEYDGLCLSINKNGTTEYSESWEEDADEVEESKLLHEKMGKGMTKDDYYFLRVGELLAQQK